jgi:hypothetical protein
MIPLLLAAGLALTPVQLEGPVTDVSVVDLDLDGREDVVAVDDRRLYLLRAGEGPPIVREAAPLTVLGDGLCAVVRGGRLRRVGDPFGAWKEGPPGFASLLSSQGKNAPALLESPGDLDGDGRADPLLATHGGLRIPAGLVPLRLRARLEIYRNETFAVEFELPRPVVGNWSGGGRELVLFFDDAVVAHDAEGERTERVPLPLSRKGEEVAAVRRNHVFLRDVDGNGRLDLLVVVAHGSTSIFGAFEATARYFPGGRVYDRRRKGFFRPASFLKVAGALMAPSLVDLDGDGDLDLALSTVNTSLLAAATGTAPGTYHLFRFEKGTFRRNPAWTLRSPVPMASFQERPDPPVAFLPDLDGDGEPEALVRGPDVRLLRGDGAGGFLEAARVEFEPNGRPAVGRRLAAVPGTGGVLVVRRAP